MRYAVLKKTVHGFQRKAILQTEERVIYWCVMNRRIHKIPWKALYIMLICKDGSFARASWYEFNRYVAGKWRPEFEEIPF